MSLLQQASAARMNMSDALAFFTRRIASAREAGRDAPSLKALSGWGCALVVGAMLMLPASHHDRGVAPAVATAPPAVVPAVADAASSPPPAAVASPAKDPLASLANAAAADPAASSKTTLRVDTTPTGAIAVDPKSKHKVHKKKARDIDNHP